MGVVNGLSEECLECRYSDLLIAPTGTLFQVYCTNEDN